MPSYRRAVFQSLFALGCAVAVVQRAEAYQDWPDLIQGAPPGANAIGLVDVSFLREQAEGAPETASILETLKGVLSDNTVRGAFVAEMKLSTMEPAWEAGIVVTTQALTPEKLAKLSHGRVDKIEGMNVVWTPRNTYMALVGDDRVVAYRPADRRALAKLLREKKAKGPHPLSPYLASVVKRGTSKTPVVMGLDLTDSVSPAALPEQLKSLASLADADVKINEVADLLVDIEGVLFTVQADQKGMASLRVEFRRSPQILAKVGKAMVLEILGRAGAELPEMADWKAIVQGNSLELTGKLGKFSLSHVLSLFNTPYAIGSMQSHAAASPGNAEMSEAQKIAVASKRYFSNVNKVIENVRGFSAQTLGQRALWCDREGRKISQMPVLDVDPELLDWGAAVSSLLRGTGLTIRNVNMKAATMEDVSMVSAGGGGGGYGWGGYGWGTPGVGGGLPSAGYNAGAAARDSANINLKANQNLAAQGSYLEAMGQIDSMTPVVRRKMTERYRIEF